MTRACPGRLLATAALLLALLLSGCSTEPELEVYWQAPAFQLFDQDGEPVSDADYAGTVWVASFIFTNCTDICPAITSRMVQVQRELEAQGLFDRHVRLVSFSVDPERDTPPVLRRYAEERGADLATWDFLTGPRPAVEAVVTDGFKVAMQLLPDSDQVVHTGRLMVVDRHGQIRALHSFDESTADEIVEDIARLAR